jgi:hypothetical protein
VPDRVVVRGPETVVGSPRLLAGPRRAYQEWIANGRRLTGIVAEMERVCEQTAEILLRQGSTPSPTTFRRSDTPPKPARPRLSFSGFFRGSSYLLR